MYLREFKGKEHVVSSWMESNFDHYMYPPLFRLSKPADGS